MARLWANSGDVADIAGQATRNHPFSGNVAPQEKMVPLTLDELTAHQLRQARQSLGWSIARLAVASGTSEYVIAKLEQHGHAPTGYPLARSDDPVAAILTALKVAGIAFDGDAPVK